MPRTSLTALRALGPNGSLYTTNAADLAVAVFDRDNKNQTPHTGKILVVVHNTGLNAPTVTISSVRDSNGRLGNIAGYPLPAGEYALFGPFDLDGWAQTDMQLYLEADDYDSDLRVGVIDLSHS